ncbi:MAG: copper amine oxidase N-terminal domain-containing protein [Clostridiales bacterium]|nr:copper amine oxidase N-terminal domain-containing protein [Clostridiales bacterium]
MKRKLALLMAAIMTVAMVPMTAFASTKLTAVDEISTGIGDDYPFESRVELTRDDDTVKVTNTYTGTDVNGNEIEVFDITLKLTNGYFTESTVDDDYYYMDNDTTSKGNTEYPNGKGVINVEVLNDTTATVTLNANIFNDSDEACVLTIYAYAIDEGDVIAKFSSNIPNFTTKSCVIATAYDGDVEIEIEGVKTFVEDSSDDTKTLKDITIVELTSMELTGADITLKLTGNYEFVTGFTAESKIKVNFANQDIDTDDLTITVDDDKIVISFSEATKAELKDDNICTEITIRGIQLTTTKSTDAGDVAKIKVSSKDFDTVTLEVARMVEEAVTYSVDYDDLPVLYAGQLPQNNEDNEGESLTVYIEENTGDILNTSRKATFTFPDGIEVVDINVKGVQKDDDDYEFKYEIDENVVKIYNYGEKDESDETDMEISFILSAAPWFEGDVEVTLGGELDDVEFTVATVVAPYTVEAKISEVLIDYRYVPVNEIVITEAEEGLLKEDDVIILQVEKMDFEDAGTYEVTEGDIEVDVTINDGDTRAQLVIEITDESTEASTITISGLELYLDRTLPVGGYALENIQADNILWENSHQIEGDRDDQDDHYAENTFGYYFELDSMVDDDQDDEDDADYGYDFNGIFEYDEVTINDSYVEVVTAARDQDDSTTSRKIIITIGATTMTVGTETITLDAPAYINSEDYTMLPVRAISEAFGATVTWDDASKTVTVLSGQRIISMTIGSKTMYINGTPVAMNTAAEITSDRTFIPVRDLANALGISAIDWNEASATVTLN